MYWPVRFPPRRPRTWRAHHSCALTSGPKRAPARRSPPVWLKKNEKSKQTERRGWRPSRMEGRAPPPGVTCVLPVRVMRASSSCASRGEASALTRNGGGKGAWGVKGSWGAPHVWVRTLEYPGAARRPAASVTVNQIHCRRSSPPLNSLRCSCNDSLLRAR